MPALDIQNASIRLETTKTLIQANHMNWILAEQSCQAEVNTEVRCTAEAEPKTTILGAISTRTKARPMPDIAQMKVLEMIRTIEERLIDTTEERQEDFRTVAKKINMKRNITVSDYATRIVCSGRT